MRLIPLIILLTLTGATSCTKFLDEKPDLKVSVPLNTNELQALLDDPSKFNILRSASFMEAAADDYFMKPESYRGLTPEEKQVYRFEPHIYGYINDWAYAYDAIYISNYCLDKIGLNPVTELNQKQIDNVVGSALFYRSFFFLNMTLSYSKAYDASTAATDPGISLRLQSEMETPTTRASVAACFERIIADAKEAVPLLPSLPQHVFRPSKAAAYGLLARAYLNMHNYDSALHYADLELSIKSSLMDYNGDADLFSTLTANVPFRRFNKEVIFHSEQSGFLGLPPTHGFIDTILYATYSTNDLRKTGFFRANSGYFKFKGNYAQGQYNLFDGIATDEMFLIRAECRAKKGDIEGSMSDLNKLLIKRWKASAPYVPLTAATSAAAVNLVRRERRKELLMRGLRFADIKRYNKEDSSIVQTRVVGLDTFRLQPNGKYYALPLPDDIIRLTGIQQN